MLGVCEMECVLSLSLSLFFSHLIATCIFMSQVMALVVAAGAGQPEALSSLPG